MQIEPCEYHETLLKVEDVNVSYGSRSILRNLNLEIRNLVRPGKTQGQVVGLLGPSGVGKTTLFRVLAGLSAPDSGQVLVGDPPAPVKRGDAGVVAQHYPLFAHRKVLGNLVVAGKQAGTGAADAERQARELLKRFGLEEQAEHYPSQLSGGQRQRVAIAQQFMCSEHFLLMDEPFSGLDLLAIDNVIEFICEIAASDELKTLIIVTHDITSALQVSDTVLLLGREHDAEGKAIPGAHIRKSYSLVERGLAWQKGITSTKEFLALREEIRQEFRTL
jgi:NitT/TauT family transport system ATP-binding protein